MTPQRMASNEVFENGLKNRVTACRKRLRVNRSVHKVQLTDERLALGEPTAGLHDQYPAARESLVCERDAFEFRDDGEVSQRVEQEVGLT